jgi:hypothetical protein
MIVLHVGSLQVLQIVVTVAVVPQSVRFVNLQKAQNQVDLIILVYQVNLQNQVVQVILQNQVVQVTQVAQVDTLVVV